MLWNSQKKIMSNIKIKTKNDKIDYIRGYFDAEGSVPRSQKVRFYIYFSQKNKKDLKQVKAFLEELGIVCGKIHNPSKEKDPDYWRFFISCISYETFIKIIGSWHPIKKQLLRMKI